MIQFYKPNSKNAGFACSFSVATKNKAVYCQLLKQKSWNGKNGSFDISSKENVKFGLIEVAKLIDALENNLKADCIHKIDDVTTTIILEPWLRDENQVGYSFRVTRTRGQNRVSFVIGFDFAEGRLLREFLLFSLRQIFFVQNSTFENTPRPEQAQQNDEQAAELAHQEEPNPEDLNNTSESPEKIW
jgi:hypothetical protein